MASDVTEAVPVGAGACIPNIGPAQRRMRVRVGAAGFVLVAAVAAVMLAAGASRAWRLALLLPLWGAAVSVLQVRAKTCVKLAARGQRNMDGGPEAISDPAELAQVRRQARRVYLDGLLLAAALTLVLVFLPVWVGQPK